MLTYFLIRVVTLPFAFMPYRLIRLLGSFLGLIGFYAIKNYRKRALSNLALAGFSTNESIKIAKLSFQNLAINLLEYPRFFKEKDFLKIIKCENAKRAEELYKKGQGIVFFCGHQSNWETLFLDGNIRMKGVAIGQEIKNKHLYKWIVEIREKTGGKIVNKKEALRTCLKCLKKGLFVGILGDQSTPESNYSFPLFKRRTWISTAPALLAYKTSSPIIVATTKRTKRGYTITYSDPIWPNTSEPLEKEIARLMDSSLTILERTISQSPGEWLWQHNCFKQQTPNNIYKEFRHDSICIILPNEEKKFTESLDCLKTLKDIYSRDFLFIMAPEKLKSLIPIKSDEIITYNTPEEILKKDFRFKLIFNFTNYAKIKPFYKNLSAFKVINREDFNNQPDTLKSMLLRHPS